ncbi:PilZ domain-containing protein [Roseibacterium beibuensis]|uniref:PilZ domain-containing protein n=1 Tax=[Roseibacterium] beibuensis TaxID=1193142 RepID=UPI00217DAB69|nr:PilZ domain-containing protein [Roseibacterium beibuensis]MCS6626400.1 PilZ domain-containing protein [Roseibacterium beibuensis]
MDRPEDRRLQPRSAANLRGIVLAPGLELSCLIVDQSGSGARLRLDRNLALPGRVVIIDVGQATAAEADVVWRKGQEAGIKRVGAAASLRGLVPSRLAAARAAFLRAGGR